jgi:hypothetical protein
MEERIVQADPVGDPQGYQREILTLLGGGAPVDVLAATALAIGERAKGVSEELLTRRPEPKEWSVAEVLGHLWDAEIAYSFRARLMLAQDSPRLIGYDQDAWAALARPAFAELLDAFAALRTANLVLIRQTPETRWDRLGLHEERGPISFRLMTQLQAGHDRAHLKQFEQTIAAVRRA